MRLSERHKPEGLPTTYLDQRRVRSLVLLFPCRWLLQCWFWGLRNR